MRIDTLLTEGRSVVAGASDRHPWVRELPIVGVGWATVELDRAERDLTDVGCSAWEPAPRDELLGAGVRRCRDRGLHVLLLEPDSEGRLAASLARNGEGIAAVYLGGPSSPASTARIDQGLGRRASGPLGRGRLLLGRPAWGPHVVILEPGTPR